MMKITKRQLRRIIKEELLKEAGKWDDYDIYGNPKDGPKLYGPDAAASGIGAAAQRMVDKSKSPTHSDYEGLPQSDIDYYELADDFAMWSKKKGHVTPAASSVMATYFLDKGLEDDHEKHEMLGRAFKVDHGDIMADIRRQQSERAALKESIRNLLKEQMDNDFYEFRHQEDQKDLKDHRADVVFEIIESNQGISGPDLVSIALRNSVFGGAQAKDVHETLDFLLDYGDIRFNHEEDQWSTVG